MLELECNPPPPFEDVHCGATSCAPGQVCQACNELGGDALLQECVTPGVLLPSCGFSVILHCDGNDDCAPGEQCTLQTGDVTRSAWCQDIGLECTDWWCQRFCDSDADCPVAGKTCQQRMVATVEGTEVYGPVGLCSE
jgi:hypothetical protein